MTNIELWIDALRNGEYEQSKRVLKDYKGFCCLGVACEIYRENVGGHWDEEGCFHEGEEDYSGMTLPVSIQGWLGVEGDDPTLGEFTASHLNDVKGLTFDQIADLLEDKYVRT